MKLRSHGKRPTPGEMNNLEREFQTFLEIQKRDGVVLWYEYEPVKFRLANATTYTPDFLVMLRSLSLVAYEVKGFWQDDARVKIKVAADKFPIEFIGVTKGKGGWEFEPF